ncbi:6884_t:CDS:2 [Ambispora gerdemannii]|uniref:6884_t:CDS:1 n=1 Tax=Ambispora gerdemannii TaxID=144530 RepID=A0A9N9BQM7_9GLOM|nr:6884_t:CDS:2 [Ambispora gerdemannii]
MKQHKVQFLATTLDTSSVNTNVNKATARNDFNSHSDRDLRPASTMPRGHFGISVFNTRDISKYQIFSDDYFDRTFAQQAATSKREQLLRKLMGILAASVIGALLFYIWFTSNRDLSSSSSKIRSSASSALPPYISDQISLYRILGNDLPPRHKTGQTLQNVKFILDNEPKFPNTKKWWILNRIVDREYEETLIALLDERKQDYIRIPFKAEEYLRQDFRLEDFPEPDFFHSDEYKRFSKVAKLRTLDYTYHEKNLYAMNNNGGRNIALFHGKAEPRTRWIMPFDGNCFLTANAFAEILSRLEEWGDRYKYFIVPMARLLNNTNLLTGPDSRPITPEEPQIIFRNDAEDSFDPKMRYGRRSKLELLWRLGVISSHKILNKAVVPWETQEMHFSREKNHYKSIGWVFRLFSGQALQEENKKEASSLRAFNRLLAIQNFLDGIDEKLARAQGFDSKRLFQYDEKLLNRARFHHWSGDAKISRVIKHLISKADNVISSVMTMFRESDLQINDNSATYYELRDSNKELSPSINTTNSENYTDVTPIETVHNENFVVDDSIKRELPSSSSSSETPTLTKEKMILPEKISLSVLFENVTTLTLAHYFSSHKTYVRWAANLIRTFLLSSYSIGDQNDFEVTRYRTDLEAVNDEGYSFPNLNMVPRALPKPLKYKSPKFLQELHEVNPSGFLDACRLLYRAQALTHKEYTDLISIASDWLEYLVNSPKGINIAQLPDHRSTLYDLQVTSLAGFVDDLRLYLRVVNRLRMRIRKHFYIANGANPSSITQPQEIKLVQNEIKQGRIKVSEFSEYEFRYTTLNLQYWMLLTRGIQNIGVGADLWQYTAKEGQRLSRAMMGHLGLNDGRLEDDMLKPLLHIAQTAHQASDEKRGIWHEHGDEHDYFQHFLKNIGGKMDIFKNNYPSSDSIIDLRVGIGAEARRQGIPPFWMLGVA